MKSKEAIERQQRAMRARLEAVDHAMAERALAKCQGRTSPKPLAYDPTHFNQEREAGIISETEAELERRMIEKFEREGWDQGVWRRRA